MKFIELLIQDSVEDEVYRLYFHNFWKTYEILIGDIENELFYMVKDEIV